VVTKDVPPYAIVAGVPARQIAERFPDPADREQHEAMLREPPRRGAFCPPIVETAPELKA
ncbi:MAG: antibiotic acetyltransferase, partial [Planctomycetota bacterium]